MVHMRRISNSRLNPVRRVVSSSKREVVLGTKRSRPSSEESSDTNAILTSQPSRKSSRPNSQGKETASVIPKDPPISDTQFYLDSGVQPPKPKSLFERSYEAKLQKFLLTDESSDFLALELETNVVSSLPPSLVGRIYKSEETNEEPEETTLVETEPEVEITQKGILQLTENPDFICHCLIKSADIFLEEAYGNVLAANYIEGAKAYYKLIKAAMKALHMVVSQYMACLQPREAALVLYKLAQIYLDETENYSTAEQFAKRALGIASRNNLLQERVAAELLCAKILKVSDVHLLEPFLNERQELYEKENKPEISILFALKRIELTRAGDPKALTSALETAGQSLGDHIRCLCLLTQSSIPLSQGSPEITEKLLQECRGVFFNMKKVEPQLKAMLYLQMLAVSTQTNAFKIGKKWIKKLTDFIQKQNEEKWASWNKDGTIPISAAAGSDTVTILLQWIAPDDFIPVFYLTSGVFFINESSDLAKAAKLFESCLSEVEKAIAALTTYRAKLQHFRVSYLTTKIVRLSAIKFMAIFYKVLLLFMASSDFTGIQSIHAFLDSYNSSNFTAEELWYYKFLVPYYHYLSAMYHQAQGNLKAAKYMFLRVRSLASQTDNPVTPLQQQFLGIGHETLGKNSELYIYSTMHLLNIVEYEFQSLSHDNQHEQAIQSSRSFLASLHADMTRILEDPSSGVILSNTFMLTYKSAAAVFYNCGFREVKRADSALASEIEKLVFSNSIHIQNVELLALYLLLRLAVNLDQSNRLYGKCLRRITKNEDNGKLLSLFVYLEAQRRELGDDAKAEKIQRKIDALKQSVQSKIDAARQSLHIESSDRDI